MKNKILILLIIGISIFGSTGCNNDTIQEEQNNNINNNITSSENINNNKIVLELEDYSTNPVNLNLETDNILKSKEININHTLLQEEDKLYNNEKELDDLVKYIKDTFDIEINNKWKVFIHYYNEKKTTGMVEFQYIIGEINTNRSILFNLKDNKYDMVYYKCLTEKINEKDILNRVNSFKSKYVQGKRDLKVDETFYEEQINYTYYINSNTLVYSYAYFYKYDLGFISNDWGTLRIIDENGNAILIR